ncbi:MAG: multidrug effflux MFS transporter [Pseudomonadota bacterium]
MPDGARRLGPRVGAAPPTARMGPREVIAFVAATMALNAFAIDMMLPALGLIDEALGARSENDRQLVIIVYIIGNGIAQLFFGPLVDRFGRRRVLVGSLFGYLVGCVLSVIAGSFTLLLAARAFQGVATAGARVAVIASVRDQVAGRRMAEVMSFAITIFMAAPIVAPGIGQVVLAVASWRMIFIALLVYGVAVLTWAIARMPETLAAERRAPLRPGPAAQAYLTFASNGCALGYTLVSTMCFSALFGFISMSEQLFNETFGVGEHFGIVFGSIAGALGAATLVNAKLVGRFGMRRLTHAAVVGFVVISAAHVAAIAAFGDVFPVFMAAMCGSLFCLGLIGPNCNALAMEPMGRIAGAAAAAYGFISTTLAGVIGGVIGRFYDGSTGTVAGGFLALGLVALVLALIVENGRLFRPGVAA